MSNKVNMWDKMVSHRGCIFPCSGKPVIKHKPGKVRLEADDLPAYLTCDNCGYTPLSDMQPTLVARYLRYWVKHLRDGRGQRQVTHPANILRK